MGDAENYWADRNDRSGNTVAIWARLLASRIAAAALFRPGLVTLCEPVP